MADNRLVLEWLNKADEDFEFAKVNFEEGRNFYPQICFHFQQSAEKYLKAFIVAKELEFKKIHDLSMLLKQCQSAAPLLAVLREDCEFLAAFYMESRYPVHWPTNFSRDEAAKALQAALHIRTIIKTQIEGISINP